MTTTTDSHADDLYAPVPSTAAPSASKPTITPFGVIVMVIVLGLIGVVAYGVYRSQQETLDEGIAPAFSLRVYDDDNIQYTEDGAQMYFSGEEIELSDFENSVVVMNVWQTNCAPCHEEAEMLERVFRQRIGDGVMFIGVNAKDPDSLAHGYLADYNITYPNGLDRGDRIQDQYRTTGYPETFIIAKGEILAHYAGPITEGELNVEIDEALTFLAKNADATETAGDSE